MYCDILKVFLMEEYFYDLYFYGIYELLNLSSFSLDHTNQLSCLLGLSIGNSLVNFCISDKTPYI